jgi:hypothetical protein
MDSNFTKKAVLFLFGLAITTMSAQQLKKIGATPIIYRLLLSLRLRVLAKGFNATDTSQRTGIISPRGYRLHDTDQNNLEL